MNEWFRVRVYGTPAPQGSKRPMPIYRGSKAKGTREFTGKTAMIESSKKVAPWRDAVSNAALVSARAHGISPTLKPVHVEIRLSLKRPQRPKHRDYHVVYPDLDKLIRSTMDALTGIVWKDDAQVVHVSAWKLYAGYSDGALPEPGAEIAVYTVQDATDPDAPGRGSDAAVAS